MKSDKHPTPEDLAQPAPGARPFRRPFGIYAILVLLALQGIAGAVALGLVTFGVFRAPEEMAALLELEPWELPVLAAEVIFVLVTAAGLWLYKPWAWPLVMLILAYWLGTDAYDYFFAEPNYFSMLLDVALFFYLNQREVRGLFDSTAQGETAA